MAKVKPVHDRIAAFSDQLGKIPDEKIAKMAKVPVAAVLAARQAAERARADQVSETAPVSSADTDTDTAGVEEAPSGTATEPAPSAPTEPADTRRPTVIQLRRAVRPATGPVIIASVYDGNMVGVVLGKVGHLLEAEPDLVRVLAREGDTWPPSTE